MSVSLPGEDFTALERLAQAEHTSVTEYVRAGILKLARAKPRRTPEEVRAIIRVFREEVQAANPDNGDLLTEFLEERRREAEFE